MAPQVGDRPPPPHMCVPGPSPISAALPATARLSPSRWDPGHGRGPARPGRRSAGRASPPWLSAFCSPCFLQPPLPRLHPPPRPQWDCAPANSVRAGSTALQYSVPDPLSLSPPGLCREGGGDTGRLSVQLLCASFPVTPNLPASPGAAQERGCFPGRKYVIRRFLPVPE